ncbi:unnamed protein product [Cuscuta campestris]|uniref:Uncharacterized protein n=1 Tax=Cuscuta campestris TaxID=132261 RepID=A0A484LS19_9ASTE|nr:unnamed protein product [Cuscuta campestris]
MLLGRVLTARMCKGIEDRTCLIKIRRPIWLRVLLYQDERCLSKWSSSVCQSGFGGGMENIEVVMVRAKSVGEETEKRGVPWQPLQPAFGRPQRDPLVDGRSQFQAHQFHPQHFAQTCHSLTKNHHQIWMDTLTDDANLERKAHVIGQKVKTRHGKNAFMWMGPTPEVLIMEPEMIREIFSKHTPFQKPPSNRVIKLFAQGVAMYEKDKWAKHRKLLNPAFHMDKLKHMVPSFYVSCLEMLSKWDNIIGTDEFDLNVYPYLKALTADAISRAAFGSSYDEGRKIFELQKEQGELAIQVARSLYVPGMIFLPTKTNMRMKQIFNQVRSLILGIIDKRIKAMEEEGARSDDLLGIMHLDWQERAREEVIQVIGITQEPDFVKLNQLKIVTMILNEVLRLYPPGIMFGRMLQEDTKLGNMTLPSGVQLIMPLILLQQDEEMWGVDAKDFNHERFSGGISNATKGKFCFFPFGWGPRICIGQNFSMLEAKMAFSMILRHYAFELSPSYAHAPQTGTTLLLQYGAQLILRKIRE